MYRKYYSYNDMPVPADTHREEKKAAAVRETAELTEVKDTCAETSEPVMKPYDRSGRLFGRFENDDILLLAVIFILLADGCDDDLLIIALAAIFIMGK